MFCIVIVVSIYVCIVTIVRVHVLYCDSGTCICFVLWQRYVYMFCVVRAVRVHVLYCDSGTCTCFVLWLRYVYMFCIVTAVRVHVLFCDSGTREKTSLTSTVLCDLPPFESTMVVLNNNMRLFHSIRSWGTVCKDAAVDVQCSTARCKHHQSFKYDFYLEAPDYWHCLPATYFVL